MNYAKPTQMLVDEHEVILSVLDAVETVVEQLEPNAPFPQEFFEQAFDFFPTFVDKCHHAKEEDHLFPLLEARGIPRTGGPIGVMLSEHDEGRQHVRAIKAALERTRAGDVQARAIVRREARAYIEMLRNHIAKENQVLFVMGDQVMSEQDKEELWHKFQCAAHSALPAGTHEKYVTRARELAGAAGQMPADPAAGTHRGA